jgi:putative membrane protein
MRTSAVITHPARSMRYSPSIHFTTGGNQMNRLYTAVCCLALVALPAFGQKKAAAKGGMSDQEFVQFAAQTDMVEANLGQLAGNSAESQEVKDYAQTLVTDHTNDFEQLKTAAQQASLDVPTAIDASHNKSMIEPFQKLKAAAFDKKYVQEMVAGHTKAIAMYKKASEDAQNPAIKSYAAAALPVLQKHLDSAKDLAKAKPAKAKAAKE